MIIKKLVKSCDFVSEIIENHKYFRHYRNTYVEFNVENNTELISLKFDLDGKDYFIYSTEELIWKVGKNLRDDVIDMIVISINMEGL